MKRTLKKFFRYFGFDVVKGYRDSISSDKIRLYKTKTGNYFLPAEAYSDVIAIAIRENKIFDEPILDIAKKCIKEGTTVLDVGSNFGQMAVLMSKMVGKDGVVHAFEADDFVFSLLEKNCKENAANIIPHYTAVHDISGKKLFFPKQDFKVSGTYGSYGIDYAKQNGREVVSSTIDELNIQGVVSFIKIDIQGGDLFALRGAMNTIIKNQCPVIFEYEYAFEDKLQLRFQEYVDFVQSINYKFEKVISGHNFLIVPNTN